MSFKGIDETCADNEHLVIYTLFDETDMNYDLIKPSMVLRLHRMQVSQCLLLTINLEVAEIRLKIKILVSLKIVLQFS